MFDQTLEYDLNNLINPVELNEDEAYYMCHIYLDVYKKTKDSRLLPILNRLNDSSFPSIYAELPYLVGYDSIVNNMKNYHLLIPVITSIKVYELVDLFTIYKCLTYVKEEMYDEFSQVQKKFLAEANKFRKKIEKSNNQSLEKSHFDIMIRLAIGDELIEASAIKLVFNEQITDEKIKLINELAFKKLEDKGILEVMFCE